MRLLPLLVAAPLSCNSFVPCNHNYNSPISRTASIILSSSSAQRQHHHHDDVLLHAMQRSESLELGERCETTTRRGMLSAATASLLALAASPMVPTVAIAEEETISSSSYPASSSPKLTALVTLNVSIARGPPRPLRIELFQAAPAAAVEFFSSLAEGTLKAPCEMGDNPNIEICEEYQSINVGYKGSQLWRLVPNKRMDFGRVDSMFTSRIPPTISRSEVEPNNNKDVNIDSSMFKPSTRGAVSIKRGGGAFEFTVTPAYNPSLDSDKEDLVVVGRIATDDLSFIDEINQIVVRKDIVKVGDVPPLGAKFARACDFTAPDSTCAQFKPLRKIIVTDASVVAMPSLE